MPRRKVVSETVYNDDEVEQAHRGGNGNGKGDDLSLADDLRDRARQSKYEFLMERNNMELTKLRKEKAALEATGDPADSDDIEKTTKDIMKVLKNQIMMKSLMKMAGTDDDDGGKKGLRGEISEFAQYTDRKLDRLELMIERIAQAPRKDDNSLALMMQQQGQQSTNMLNLFGLMMNRKEDPLMPTLIKSLMDNRTGIKDILPLMTQMQMMGMQQTSKMDEMRMGMLQDIIMQGLSAGEKDWGTMSLAEKAEFVMGIMKRGGEFVMEKAEHVRKFVKGDKEDPKLEGGREKKRLLDKTTDKTKTTPETPPPKTETPATGDAKPEAEAPKEEAKLPVDAEVEAAIKERVATILKAVRTEMKIGSDPFLIAEELERVYFGLPEKMRGAIEAGNDPSLLLKAIEPYAEKAILDDIIQMAMMSKDHADWLKAFQEGLMGEEEGEEDDEPGEGGEKEEEPEGGQPA